MKKRRRVNPRKDKRIFSKTADIVPKRNYQMGVMRGGIRM